MGALSTGCGTCKRRKVKCDEMRPKCNRCLKAGLDCEVLPLRLRFINENPRIQRSIAVCQAQLDEAAKPPEYARRTGIVQENRCTQELARSPTPSQSIPPVKFNNDLFMSFLASKLLGKGGVGNNQHSPLCGMPARWLDKRDQAKKHKAWSALAIIIFGLAHKNLDSVTDSYAIYGQALSNIRTELSVPKHTWSEDTLASMTALYMYEILAARTEHSWVSHANGISWLFELRGPSMHKRYDMKGIFLEHRIMLVGKSIVSGTSTFLRELVWKTVPWEDDPASKTPVDYLVDIGTDICEYNFTLKSLDTYLNQKEQHYQKLAAQVARSIEELNGWWRKWEVEHRNAAAEIIARGGSPLFPSILEYKTPWEAFTICIYDVMRILLLELWEALRLSSNFHLLVLDETNDTAFLGITSDIKALACEILRSLGYSYRLSRRFVYTVSFLVISDVVYGCFDPDSREARWLVEHGWAEVQGSQDIEDRNILKVVLPLGQIKIQKWGLQ